jgi:curli biogenesis system outer membrane secretion channel CsgG
MKNYKLASIIMLAFLFCSHLNAAKIAKETPSSKNAKNAQTVQENGLKRKVAIARFSNETTYAKGAFYDKENDPLGKQTVDILSAKLAASGKFILLERSDLDAINAEQSIAGLNVQKIGADYLIIGSLTKYGRKNTGETGLVSRTKRQTVEAGVSIRLVDVSTGQIIYSEEANGTAETQTKTTLGMGGQAGFDATLSDKAIDAAISQLVENIVNNCMDRPWKSYFLSVDDDSVIISGGKSQGVKVGDVFDVLTRGKKVKNPQSGMMIELPGKSIGTVTVVMTGGDDPVNEWSLVDLDAKIDKNNLMAYIIQEKE